MELSERSKIVLPLLLIFVFVFSMFGWIYWFQNHQMEDIIEAERLLDQINEEVHEINSTIQSGILTLNEKYAVKAAGHSLRIFEKLAAFGELHPEDAAEIRRMYVDYYVKLVSIDSLFLEKRLEEGRVRLAELDTSFSRMNAEMKRMINHQIGRYRKAVGNINRYMAATSVIFTALLTLIAGLFMHYSSKRKEAEKALIESEKRASLGTLSAGVAHEIRNPLTIILHGIEHLDNSLPADFRKRGILDGIRQAVLRAEGIIKGLLSFAQGPASVREKMDLCPVIEEALLMLVQQKELRDIRIEKEVPPDPPETLGDKGQLREAFLNILVNAVEAMPGGGTVRLLCRRTASDSLAVTIADTGAGIPETELGNVSDPFYTTKQKLGKVGLGLSIARGIVEAHGGTLKIESSPREGTRVTVTLPVPE